jgi:hypothetical protein
MQLKFLLNHEDTKFRIAENVYDLTQVQIYFLYLCAVEKHEQYEAIRNGYQNNGTCFDDNPYAITDNDSPEVMREKLDMIKIKAKGN